MNGDESAEEDDNPNLNEVFEILSSPERRKILYCLDENGESHVYDAANYIRRNSPEEPELDKVALNLTQNHLPKMDDLGVIEYNREENIIEYDGDTLTDETLELAEEYEDFDS